MSKIEPLVRMVAIEILKGGKTSDVARTYGVKKPAIAREYLHKFCRKVNREVYEELAVEAVARGQSAPFQGQLQNHKERFLPPEEFRYRPPELIELVKEEYAQQKELVTKIDRENSVERIRMAQLRREIHTLAKLAEE